MCHNKEMDLLKRRCETVQSMNYPNKKMLLIEIYEKLPQISTTTSFLVLQKYRCTDGKLCSGGIIQKVSIFTSSPSFGFCIIKILEYKWQSSFIMYSLLLPPPLDPSIKMEVSSLGQSAHRARQITHYQEPYNPSNPSSKLQSTKYK